MLTRPIIVISLKTIRNIQPIDLRGIYLPILETDLALCCKDPIVIAFHDYHFVPLVYALDNNPYTRPNEKNRAIKFNEKYFLFEKVDQTNENNSFDDYDSVSNTFFNYNNNYSKVSTWIRIL